LGVTVTSASAVSGWERSDKEGKKERLKGFFPEEVRERERDCV
jgi:hypothetical protein